MDDSGPKSTGLRGAGLASALVTAARRARVGIVVSVRDGDENRCELANEYALTLLGRSPKDLTHGVDLGDEMNEALASWRAQSKDAAGPLAIEGRIPGNGGAETAVEVVASRARHSDRPAEVIFLFDTRARRRAEHALEASEAQFRKLLDAAPDGVAVMTLGRFEYANPTLVKLLGFDRMEDVTKVRLHEYIVNEDVHALTSTVERLMGTGTPQPAITVRLERKDGGVVPVEAHAMLSDWGANPGVLLVVRDLSERHRAQAKLIEADRLAAIGTLAAGVAHEINNPLAYVLLNLQYLMREVPRFDGKQETLEKLTERLAEADHGARRVSTIVGDLHAFARPEGDERKPVSVARAARSAIRVAEGQIKGRARLVQDLDDAAIVEASTTRLEQVLLNLLVNAAQAIPEGDPDDNEVRLVVATNGNEVTIEVSDSGKGIPKGVRARVFDPFFTTKPRGTGTGLGLPICHSIVTSLDGEIDVLDHAGGGTTFRVSLPALPGPKPLSSAPDAAPPSVEGAGARLLVIDDEPLVADMLQRTLSDHHDVTIATSGREALELLERDSFDVVFCDLLMPQMSGMDLYAELRSRKPGVEKKLVFMTGGAFTPRASKFLSSVPNKSIRKPFDLGEIEAIVGAAERARG